MAVQHYRNLTNGLKCNCSTPHCRFIRLQSTACEQKHWDKVLHELGADFYFELARGTTCIVHDKSEKNRETRACWQGLSWIRYACHRAWDGGKPPTEFSRGNMNISPYWEEQFKRLPTKTRRMLEHYRKYYNGGIINAYSCWLPDTVEYLKKTGHMVM